MSRSLIAGFMLAAAICCTGCTSRMPSVEVRTPLSPTGVRLEGMGVELDPHFISQNVTRDDGATLRDWQDIVVRRVKSMDVQRFRVMLLPHWWEPVQGVFTFDNVEMQSLYAVLDLAQETGAEVTLVLWGCPAYCSFIDPETPGDGQRYFNCDPDGRNWVTAPRDNEAFAANFSILVKHLIEVRGYTCVKEVTPFNEPDGDVCDADRYIGVVKAMDRRFREDGIRDKVRFNLSDNTDSRRFFLQECADSLAGYADLFNSHTYIFGYESPNSASLEWEKENLEAVATTGKKHFVGEFGSNLCVGSSRQKDINWYERGVLLVRNCLNFLNAGAAGASYWSLIDQYYNRDADYGTMQQLGLWRYKKDIYRDGDIEGVRQDYETRPAYYAYSLLTRFVRRSDIVYPLDLGQEYAAGAAFTNPEGVKPSWTYIFANGSDEDLEFDLSNGNDGRLRGCSIYLYAKGGLPADDSMIAPSGILRPHKGRYRISLPALSVVVMVEKQ